MLKKRQSAMSCDPIQRRSALQAMAAASVCLVGANAAWPLTKWGYARPSFVAAALASLRDRASAREVGSAYLAAHPGQGRPQIVAALREALGIPAAAPVFGRRAMAFKIDRARSDDFGAGRVIELDGWILSRTEAQLCALAALA